MGTCDRRTIKLYVNGVLKSSENVSGAISFPGRDARFLCIGGDSGSDGGTEACFTGRIVTANVYGRALTDYEIEQLYNQYSTFAFIPESGYQFDLQGRKLYGLDLTALTAQNIENAFLNNNLYVETDRRIGTGTEIVLKDSSGEIYDTAEVVIFGDVNGDGWYDGQDATVVSCLANGMLTEGDVSAAEYMAADCNHDGMVDNLDAEILNRAGVLLAGVDQSKSPEELMTDSAYIEYLNLISQNASDDKPEDEQAEGCFKKFIHKVYNFIMVIVNKIKSFFKRLCTV